MVDYFTSGGPKGIFTRGLKDMFCAVSALLTIIYMDPLQTGMIADNGKSQA